MEITESVLTSVKKLLGIDEGLSLIHILMAKEMGISLHCPNYIDISRLRPEKGQKDDAS